MICYQIIHLYTRIARKRKQSNAQMVGVKSERHVHVSVSMCVMLVTLLYTV